MFANMRPAQQVTQVMLIDNFATERLFVHYWRPILDDSVRRKMLEVSLTSILTQPVLKHLPPPLQLDHQGGNVSSWIDARAREADVLLIDQRKSEDLVGLLILSNDHETDHMPTIHIGYLLAESAWGRGIATELLVGLVSAAEIGGPVKLVGGVDKGNPASARVLEKAGFAIDPDRSTHEIEMFFRSID